MTDLYNIIIGKVVKSNAHIDYVCQVFNPGETDLLPEPTDYTFGTFVAIELENARDSADQLIGVIYNTLLLNPDFGNLGPRLSPRAEIEIFTPDYLSETATLVGIMTLGWRDAQGRYHQGVPALSATVNNYVQRLDELALQAFHSDERGQPALRYAQIVMGQNNPLAPQLLMTIIDRLQTLFPASRRQLTVMRNNLAWKSIVQPAS